MKSTGIVRKVDELGRVVLPIELRRGLDIQEKDSLEIFVDDDKIILKKYQPADIFTGSMDDLVAVHVIPRPHGDVEKILPVIK
jgi:transcriptional pleiotropic regulator of transition state genes